MRSASLVSLVLLFAGLAALPLLAQDTGAAKQQQGKSNMSIPRMPCTRGGRSCYLGLSGSVGGVFFGLDRKLRLWLVHHVNLGSDLQRVCRQITWP